MEARITQPFLLILRFPSWNLFRACLFIIEYVKELFKKLMDKGNEMSENIRRKWSTYLDFPRYEITRVCGLNIYFSSSLDSISFLIKRYLMLIFEYYFWSPLIAWISVYSIPPCSTQTINCSPVDLRNIMHQKPKTDSSTHHIVLDGKNITESQL